MLCGSTVGEALTANACCKYFLLSDVHIPQEGIDGFAADQDKLEGLIGDLKDSPV